MALSESWQRDRDPPQLHVFNTIRGTVHTPVQTSFSLPHNRRGLGFRLLSGPCGHAPFPDELGTAPFRPDPSQRIIALNFGDSQWYVVGTERFLELALRWEGKNVQWDKWEAKRIRVTIERVTGWDCIQVSGCRLLCIVSNSTGIRRSFLRVLDFSRTGRAKELDAQGVVGIGETTRQWSLSSDGYELPWFPDGLRQRGLAVAHDSIVFSFVSGVVDLSTFKRGFSVCCSIQGTAIHVWRL